MHTPSLPVLYPLRTVDTAAVRFTEPGRGRRRITIDHRMLAGVTPAMLVDWFTHLGDTIDYGGLLVERYRAWHPTDHIRWELWRPGRSGGGAEGARFHLVEAFGVRGDFVVAHVARVEKLDVTGIRLAVRIAGVSLFRLEHAWWAGDAGTHYATQLDLGVGSAVGRVVNPVMRSHFSDEKVEAWVRHTIEETGQLEHLLPQLQVR